MFKILVIFLIILTIFYFFQIREKFTDTNIINKEYIIIGAGPAGLQAGYFLNKFKKDYIILEKSNTVGNFFTKFPIHRKLISINKVHTGNNNKDFNLRHDWNSLLSKDNSLLFKNYSKEFFPPADIYVKYLIDYFQKKVLTIGDSVFRIGASDTVQYDGKTYDNSSPELTYFQTAWKYLPGFTLKGGLSYKINKNLTSYVNLGYLNRTPQFSNVIDNNSNAFFTEIMNEKILASEGGVNYANKNFGINFNAYATNWKNKPFPYGVAVPDPNDPTESIRVNINGMDALHMGGEVDFAYNISKKITADMMFSYGNWIWNSSKTVIIPQYDSLNISFDAKGVHVGDAAQTAIAGSIRYEPFKNFYVKMQCQYFDRYYSNFDPFTLQGANGGRESWMMPSYLLINFFTGYKYSFEKSTLIMNASITNILKSVYIADATNNGNGIYNNFDSQSAQVMFGQGFRFNVSLGLQF